MVSCVLSPIWRQTLAWTICWLIVNCTLTNKLQWHFNRNSLFSFHTFFFKISSAIRRPFSAGVKVLINQGTVSPLFQVHNDNEAVLWLWRTHNDVNHRLHGDVTEDPHSPKMQFPIYNECTDCHVTETQSIYATPSWHENHVLEFLLSYYGADNVIRDSVPYNIYAGRSYYLTEVGAVPRGPSLFVLMVFSVAIYIINHWRIWTPLASCFMIIRVNGLQFLIMWPVIEQGSFWVWAQPIRDDVTL